MLACAVATLMSQKKRSEVAIERSTNGPAPRQRAPVAKVERNSRKPFGAMAVMRTLSGLSYVFILGQVNW